MIREVVPASTSSIPVVKLLAGQTVLVPRGGRWGEDVASRLRVLGATPVIAPLINFASCENPDSLERELGDLEGGSFDWLIISSATTVDVLVSMGVRVPESTRIAAIGETTAQALDFAGFPVAYVPVQDNSARGLVKEAPAGLISGRALVPQSDVSDSTLVAGLNEIGVDATFVSAYRTVGVQLSDAVVSDVREGRIGSILISSGSVARQVSEQLHPLPENLSVVCIGPRTAFDAREIGLNVHAVAAERSSEALVDALVDVLIS
ncbi:MAG: uroporphyrinogen-III synthase [Microbacteriaceae bacterium]